VPLGVGVGVPVSVGVGVTDVVSVGVGVLASNVMSSCGGLAASRLSAHRVAVAVVVSAKEKVPLPVTAELTSAVARVPALNAPVLAMVAP
jgi:hypothetical protein